MTLLFLFVFTVVTGIHDRYNDSKVMTCNNGPKQMDSQVSLSEQKQSEQECYIVVLASIDLCYGLITTVDHYHKLSFSVSVQCTFSVLGILLWWWWWCSYFYVCLVCSF